VIENELLRTNMPAVFDELHSKHSSVNLTSAFKSNITDGLVVLMDAYQQTMILDMIKRGFSICGQHTPKDQLGHTVSFEIMMKQCYTDIPAEYLEVMGDKTSELSELLIAKGKVTWDEMDAGGILSLPQSINRDNLTHIRHWSEIVSHIEVIKWYAEEQLRRDPAVLAQQREEEQARVFIERLEADQQKKEQADEKRRVETARVASLSSVQQQQEKQHKRQNAANQRAVKQQTAREKEAAARATLSNSKQRFVIGGNVDTSDSEEGEMDGEE
jgi:hypothetical protein